MNNFIDVITLLLGMSGFSIAPNPKAPTPDASLQYAIPDADVTVHFDAGAVVPGNYKVLQALPNNPHIKGSVELSKAVRKMIGEVEGARGLAKTATGIDIASDVNDATMFLRIVPNAQPTFVAVVHGRFSAGNVDKISKMGGAQVEKVGGGSMVTMGGTDPAIGVTKDGVLLAGSPALVKERLADSWKAPPRAAGSGLAFAQEVLAQKPVFSLMLTMSPGARSELSGKIGGKNLATDMIARHKAAAFSLFADGVGWTWIDTTKAGVDNMELLSQGALELMRAGHIAPRGLSKVMLAALESYKGTDKQIDEVLRKKAELMKVVETYTGDGNFKQSVVKDAKANKLTVRAQGRYLSEVLPTGLALPAAGFALFGVRRVAPPPPVMQPPPAKVQPKPALGGKK